MANVNVNPDTALTVDDILEFGSEHIALATGSYWRKDGVARYHVKPMPVVGSLACKQP